MYQLGSFVEMKKPHACTIKATGKKSQSLGSYPPGSRHKNPLHQLQPCGYDEPL